MVNNSNLKMDKLNFSHFNVRSLCSNFVAFRDFVVDGQFDIFGLSETWLSEKIASSSLTIPDYNIIRSDRIGRGGGTTFYIKKCYKFQNLELPASESGLEQLWISIKINGKNICFGTLYRPPNVNLLGCLTDLENSISTFLPSYDMLVFGSDFNVDLLTNNNSKIVLMNFFEKYGLHQTVKVPTRITNSNSSLIDIIVTSCSDMITDTETLLMDDISDHCLVTCKVNVQRKTAGVRFSTFRDYKNFNLVEFDHDMYNMDFDKIFVLHEVDDIVNHFTKLVTYLFDKHAPYKKVRFTKPPAPWITTNIKFMMRLRNKALTKFKKHKTEAAWQDYKQLRNLVTSSLRNEKKAYLSYQFKTNPKEFWLTLRRLNIHPGMPSHHEDTGTADEFNEFFINSVPKLCIDDNTNTYLQTYMSSKFLDDSNLFNFLEVDEKSILRVVREIKSNAKGCDGIDKGMIDLILPHLLRHITFIINTCIKKNHFPAAWKIANIIPTAKNSNPVRLSDYRPISILPFLSKVLEKIMHKQLTDFVNVSKILPFTQSGFRSRHSTATALLKVSDDLFRICDKGDTGCLLLLDYSKAFDTLNHRILLEKLQYFGFSDCSLKLMACYLAGRQQRVFIRESPSTLLPVDRGVPQGSILGPLLFSIYTADFKTYLKNLSSHQYADDFQVYCSLSKDFKASESKINEDLRIIYDISHHHGLFLNPNKTQLIFVGKNSPDVSQKLNIVLDNIIITPAKNCKNLGVYFDSKLRFEKHVSYILQKSYCKLKTLYLYKDFLNRDVKLTLCKSLILPLVFYCDTVYWPALLNKDKQSLTKLVNSCLRYSFGTPKFDHVSPLYKESGWLGLEQYAFIHTCILVYKIEKFQEPHYLFDILVKAADLHDLNTRKRSSYVVPKHRTALFEKSFSYYASKCYNSLPPHIKSCSSIAGFRKSLVDFNLTL